MSHDVALETLLGQLQSGDQDAAAQIVRRFAHRLVGLAARHLDPLLRARVEAADVVQSVFKSFFLRQRDGQFELENWDGLWRVLVTMTVRKCCNWGEHALAACRDVRREIPFPRAADEAAFRWEAVAREPTPAEGAQLAELVEQLFGVFQERERAVLRLCLQGYAVAEVSAQLGCSERKVYRVLERVRTELERMQAEAA
jgi:RNA polymerase sigma-70 factor (ECF subfamily)